MTNTSKASSLNKVQLRNLKPSRSRNNCSSSRDRDTTPESSPPLVDKHDAILANPPPNPIIISSETEPDSDERAGIVSPIDLKNKSKIFLKTKGKTGKADDNKGKEKDVFLSSPLQFVGEVDTPLRNEAENQLGDPKIIKAMYDFKHTPDLKNVTIRPHNISSPLSVRTVKFLHEKDQKDVIHVQEAQLAPKASGSNSALAGTKVGYQKMSAKNSAMNQKGKTVLNIVVESLPDDGTVINLRLETCCRGCKRKREPEDISVDLDEKPAKRSV